MTFQLAFTREANRDLQESIDWYNEQKNTLGERFYSQVQKKIDKIISLPESYIIRYKDTRCAKVDEFLI